MKPTGTKHKLFFVLLTALLCTLQFTSVSDSVFAQQNISQEEPEFFMGIQILESQQQAILDSIHKVKDLQLGNMVILHPMDQAWNLTLIEEAIKTANILELYTIFECFNFSDHSIRVSPEQFSEWQSKYPRLLGVLVQEVTGKQVDLNLWENNSTGTITTRLEAEQAIIENITLSMQLQEFKEKGAKVFLQENVVSYASANTSYCDVLVTKCFNAPNTELVIGLTRGMASSYGISEWGFWVDTWREWLLPPAFTPNDVERALYEGWFYGAKYFFFEQGNFFGTLNRDGWPNKYIILGEDGKLTEYGKVIQNFYIFIQNQNTLENEQPDYSSDIAVMIGQSGWASRGKDWGLWDQLDRQGDFDYVLLNLFFPGIGGNWQIGSALTGKEFTGLPFGMVDVISIYAPASVMKQYKVIIGLGWSQMSNTIASNIEEYVDSGGVFFSLLTFTHSNEDVDDLEDPNAWNEGFASLFGVEVMSPAESGFDVRADVELRRIVFTSDTFWFSWKGKSYSYVNADGDGSWFWKFKYVRRYDEDTTVLAWVNGIQTEHNAFIIEHKKGAGYTYIVNTRNPNTLPDGVLSNVLTNFIYRLCSYYVEPLTFLGYPETEYWLSQGQTGQAVYLNHDNSTATQTFTYYVDSLPSFYGTYKDYIVFEFLNKEYYGASEGPAIDLDVTLQTNEVKLFLILEDDGEPQVICSNALLTLTPVFENQQLTVSLTAVEETTNITHVFCSQLGAPQYILGTPYKLLEDYNTENKILVLSLNSDIVVGWENTTTVSVVQSTAVLTDASWNSTLGTFTVLASGTAGQQTTIQLQTNGTKPYYVKLDGTETSQWSYDAETGVLSANFMYTSEYVEVVFGFKPTAVDATFVSDERSDVGSVQTVGFHVSWMNNGSDVEGASVYVNGTEYVTNMTGWASFDVSFDVACKTVWNVTGVEVDGLSVYAKAVADPFIVWDRINVTDVAVIDELVQAGSIKTVWLTAEFEYDSNVFDETKGTMYLNGEPMTWSSQNMRWEQTLTSSVLGPIVYEATDVDDETFGLTTIRKDGKTTITWDKIEVTKTDFDTTTIGETVARIFVAFSYSKTPIGNATVFVNEKPCTETETGTYTCKLDDGFSPIEGFDIKANVENFEQAAVRVSSLHFANTLLYTLIGVAVLLIVLFFVTRRRRASKREN